MPRNAGLSARRDGSQTMFAKTKGTAPLTDFDTLSRQRLERMLAAGEDILECYRVLEKGGANVVGEVLKGQGTFYEWDHYPEGDAYDDETHSQYYYHAHRPEGGEHGHFHTFVRLKGIPDHIKPIEHPAAKDWPSDDDVICHLAAIAMEKRGHPIHIFTTNRWVTGENWYKADDVIELLDRFVMDHAYPSWPTNRWLTAMIALFHPQICQLLRQRDAAVETWQAGHPDADAFEDRDLEVTSMIPISVERQIKQVKKALKRA